MPAAERQAVEQAITALKSVTGGDDLGEIKSKTEALAQVSMKIGEAMYKQAAPGAEAGPQAGGPQGGAGGAAGGSEKVVDADFEEVDDKKRGSG